MSRNAEARAMARASGVRSNAARLLIDPEFTNSSRVSQEMLSCALAVSDGRDVRGFIVETKGASIAVDPDGAIIGAFATRREAFRAISEQHRRP
jgi:hypothetical protein